jgi:uncharacterized membrane protein
MSTGVLLCALLLGLDFEMFTNSEVRSFYSEHLQFTFRTFTVYIQNIYSLYSEHLQFTFRTFTVYIQNIYSLQDRKSVV